MIESVIVQAIIGSSLIGLSGIIPLLFAKKFDLNVDMESEKMRLILGFGAGTLLGDAFLHLLPEVSHVPNWGTGVLIGYFFAVIAQKMPIDAERNVQLAFINLLANCIDNFTHGLAIGSAFMLGSEHGIITTLCILIHEVPHEFGDWVILLRGGFSIQKAAILQLATALAGISGAMFVAYLNYGVYSSYIHNLCVPFTIGAFMYISLTSITPELVKSDTSLVKIFCSIFTGCAIMGCVSLFPH